MSKHPFKKRVRQTTLTIKHIFLFIHKIPSRPTANIAVNILDKDGNNLSGVTIPGSSPAATYPGQTGSATEALLAAHTKIVTWQVPQDSPPGGPNVSTTVRIVSDQPIAVGSDFQFSGFKPLPCSLLPK